MWLILRQTVLLLTLVFALVGVAVPRAYAHETQRGWSRVAGIPGDMVLEDVVMAGPAVAWAVGRHEQGPPGVVYRLSLVQDRWQVARDATFDQELFGVAGRLALSRPPPGDRHARQIFTGFTSLLHRD